ncbi:MULTISPECIES: hypothetical protein [Caproicibacterium]|jgi:hypothetical protein|uniref:Phage head-tail adapter protein n=1 Tax=Caproicibacterium lactatifermentans TaxID=2666138 RepID=A0A859DR04_9FIRM|nr:hypothetical protein [Caproicibacterium lactatifermentans]ARP49983.1 hypothetical protein B6259_03260 [Ruminococcaceae bacterium CPB6]QKN24240.1 hypothetical protein GJQ69_06925 [Caproicibacterium lactatifermentans]QKO30688.1 hypothetical protein GKP14_06590 [Caproicibacterium lactatifermentans]
MLTQNAYTLTQAIKHWGKDFTVTRFGTNEYGEPIGNIPVGSFRGLFHTSSRYLNITLQESAAVSTAKELRLLTLSTDKVQQGDTVTLDNRKYSVTGTDDVGGLHLCTDISLQEV